MASLDLAEVKTRAVKGLAALTGRTFILQAVALVGFFLLSVFLRTEEIGLFFAVSELVAVLGYFSDVGLAAALIQKKDAPGVKEIRSTFTLQQALVGTLVILVIAATPWLRNYFHFGAAGVWLLWALTAGFFLASLKTIPSVLLERQLRFDLLVLVEIVETLVFYGLAVFLAWRGFGVLSYAVAVVTRGVLGVALIYLFSPWPVGFAFEKRALRTLFGFGIPFQANTLLAVVKDRFMNLFLWRMVGAEGVGILGWAQKWSQAPLRFFMDAVVKVTFPAYSRMQADSRELKRAIEKTVLFVAALVFPALVGIGILAGPLVGLIPRYAKWQVALVALYFYLVNSAWGAITTPLTNALAAVGRIKLVFRLMVMWTVLTWTLFPLLAYFWGVNGAAVAAALVAISSWVAIRWVEKHLGVAVWSQVVRPLAASLLMGVGLLVVRPIFGRSLIGLGILITLGAGVYGSIVWFWLGEAFRQDTRKLILNLKESITGKK